jgi:hypothetical protein
VIALEYAQQASALLAYTCAVKGRKGAAVKILEELRQMA